MPMPLLDWEDDNDNIKTSGVVNNITVYHPPSRRPSTTTSQHSEVRFRGRPTLENSSRLHARGRSPGNRLPRVRTFAPPTELNSVRSAPRPSTPIFPNNSWGNPVKGPEERGDSLLCSEPPIPSESEFKPPLTPENSPSVKIGSQPAVRDDQKHIGCFSCGDEGHKSLDCPCPTPTPSSYNPQPGTQQNGNQDVSMADDSFGSSTPPLSMNKPQPTRSEIVVDEVGWGTNSSPFSCPSSRAAAGKESSFDQFQPHQQNNAVVAASLVCRTDSETQTQQKPSERRSTRGGGRRRGRSKSKVERASSDHDGWSDFDDWNDKESTRRTSSRRSSRRAPSTKRRRGFENAEEFPDTSMFRTPRTPRFGQPRLDSFAGSASTITVRSQDVQLDSSVSQASLNLARQWVVRNCTLCVNAETSCGLLYARYLESVRSPCMPPANFKNFLRDSFGIMMKLGDSGAWIACGLSLNNSANIEVGIDLIDSQSVVNASDINFPASASVCASTSDPNIAEARRLLHRLLSYPELRQATQKVDSKLFDDIFALLLGCTSMS